MSKSQVLEAEPRDKLGSRPARKLRMAGRIPSSLPAQGGDRHVDFSIDEHEFMKARRHHTHVYEIVLGQSRETVVVRELQWDPFGTAVLHVEFKRVNLREETDSHVELEFSGHPKGGIINHLVTHVTVRSIPTDIPDSIEIKTGDLKPGDAVRAGDLVLPEGVTLVTPPETMIAVVVVPRAEEPTAAEPAEGVAPGEATPPPTTPS